MMNEDMARARGPWAQITNFPAAKKLYQWVLNKIDLRGYAIFVAFLYAAV